MEQQPVKERTEEASSFSANPLSSSLVINSLLSQSTKKRTHPSSERCSRAYLFQKHSDLFKFDCEFKLLSKRLKN